MSFLKYIDEIHIKNRTELAVSVENTLFSSFFRVEPIGFPVSKKFVIKKQEKAQLLLESEGQRVYLSDNMILSTISELEKGDIDWFIKSFVDFYNGMRKPFGFSIDGKEFKSVGIEAYPHKKNVYLSSDSTIDINDMVFTINYILAKDHQTEIDTNKTDFGKRTVIKYITLLDYLTYESTWSKELLAHNGYNVNDESIKFILTHIKVVLTDIKKFDISKYM